MSSDSEAVRRGWVTRRANGNTFKAKRTCKACGIEFLMQGAAQKYCEPRCRELYLKYGITLPEYLLMKEAQGGVCVICRGEELSESVLHVDHCHDTGEIRGLLCYRCNPLLGFAQNDPAVLERAAEYLRCRSSVGRAVV